MCIKRVIRISAVSVSVCLSLWLALRCECHDGAGSGWSLCCGLSPRPRAEAGACMRRQLLDLSTWSHAHCNCDCSTGRTDQLILINGADRDGKKYKTSRGTQRGTASRDVVATIHAQHKDTRTIDGSRQRNTTTCSTHETVAVASCEHRPNWSSSERKKNGFCGNQGRNEEQSRILCPQHSPSCCLLIGHLINLDVRLR